MEQEASAPMTAWWAFIWAAVPVRVPSEKLEAAETQQEVLFCRSVSFHLNDEDEGGQGRKAEVFFSFSLFSAQLDLSPEMVLRLRAACRQ